MTTATELLKDEWVRRFWRSCPLSYLDYMATQVFPSARLTQASSATHTILLAFQQTALYRSASLRQQRRLHCLTGRMVRIARGFDVEKTQGGYPRRERVRGCLHFSYTVQRPRPNKGCGRLCQKMHQYENTNTRNPFAFELDGDQADMTRIRNGR